MTAQGTASTRTLWAYETLKDRIMENRLEIGRPYLEEALASELGISRTPVREAALRLAAEGFVSIRPRQGITVRPISVTDMAEIYDILTEVEPYAARCLARKGLSEGEVSVLDGIVGQMEAAIARNDRRAWAEADRRFHAALVEMAGNRRLVGIVSTLWDQVHRARMLTLDLRPDLAGSNEDHRALIDLIRAGDAEGAERLHRRHREQAKALLIGLIETHGLGEL